MGKNANLDFLSKVAKMGHLSLGQRYQIEAYTAAGFKVRSLSIWAQTNL